MATTTTATTAAPVKRSRSLIAINAGSTRFQIKVEQGKQTGLCIDRMINNNEEDKEKRKPDNIQSLITLYEIRFTLHEIHLISDIVINHIVT